MKLSKKLKNKKKLENRTIDNYISNIKRFGKIMEDEGYVYFE